MKIAIVDSGIQLDDDCGFVFKYKHFYFENEQIIENDDASDFIGHGTAIASIIMDGLKNTTFPEIELHIIKIFENELKTSPQLLLEALRYCLTEQIDIINISLGVMKHNNDIENLCRSLKTNGAVIIAAHNQKYYNVYPACYDSVISVTSPQLPDILNQGEYIYIDDKNGKYNILAYGGKTRLKWLNSNNIILDGVSFACPKVIIDLLNGDIKQVDYDNVLMFFKRKSKMTIKYENLFCHNNIKGKTACFPFNKEIYSVLRFNEKNDISCVLDFKGRGIIGKRCSDFIKNLSYTNEINDIYILDSEDENIYNKFDNILIGDISQLMALYGDRIYTCLKVWYDSGKKLYSFLPYQELYSDIEINSPAIIDNKIFDNKYAKYSSVSACLLNLIPVVAIVGTSKNQGKYTLQQRIKRYLASKTIKAALFSTEHQGIFLNDDGSFPYGAGKYSLVDLSLERFYTLYDYLLFSMSLQKCDIIIAGLQSGIVTEHHKYRKHVVHNLCMLSMMMPETSVVIVNSQDSYKIIEKNIMRIKSFTRRTVACMVIYDIINMSDEEKVKYCMGNEKSFGIPCYGINDIEKICSSIISTLK